MKKLTLLLLSIFVLGQSFVFADAILPGGTSGEIENCIAKGGEWQGTDFGGRCLIPKNTQKYYIVSIVILLLITCGTFVHLRNNKNNSHNPLPPQQ